MRPGAGESDLWRGYGRRLQLHVTTSSGWTAGYNLDLNGLFLDYMAGGNAKLAVDGDKANSLTGSGNTVLWDTAASLGSDVGGKDGITTNMDAYVTLAGLTLADIDGATIGIRATSTGLDKEGSLKLTGTVDVPEDVPVDNFPEWDSPDVSHVTFYFDTPDSPFYVGDINGTNGGLPGPSDPEGWYTVKFDLVGDKTELNDLDDWFADAMAFIVANSAGLDTTTLAGVSIKGGTQEHWYDLDGNPADNDDANAPEVWIVENKEVDVAYDVSHDEAGYHFT